MILEIDRGHIKVKIGNRIAIVQGEMFFPGNDKMGFVVYRDTIKHWESPDEQCEMSAQDIDAIIADVKSEFLKGGHVLEIESA